MIDTTTADFQAGALTGTDATTIPDAVILGGTQLDQSNGTVNSAITITETSWTGQTFTPSSSGLLVRADLVMRCIGCAGTTPDIIVTLRPASGGPDPLPAGADLATATIAGFSTAGSTVASAMFPSPVAVIAGHSYALTAHPVTSPSAGSYQVLFSNPTNPYPGGQWTLSNDTGISWSSTGGGRDTSFGVYVVNGYPASGTIVSSVKDGNPGAAETVSWSSLSWTAATPTSTTVQLQAAASNSASGPFDFVGPDATATTFFTSGDSLAQFNGNRYLRYKAVLATTDAHGTPALQDVTTCFSKAVVTQPTALAVNPATGPLGGTVSLTAELASGASGLAGRPVTFTFDGANAGTATTDSQGVATVTGVSLAGLEPGSYPGAVAAAYAGELGFASSSGSNALIVTKAAQAIDFGPLADKTMLDSAVSVTATGGASGNPVTFSTASTACSVTGTTVSLVAAGPCAIQADQAGDAGYAAAPPVTQSFTITAAGQTIDWAALQSFSWLGGSRTLTATASSGLDVTYSIVSGPCTVTAGVLTATAPGTCVVAADQPGDATYGPASQVTQSVTVTKAIQPIVFGALANKLVTDGPFTVAATGGGSGLPVTFSTASAACSVTGTTVALTSTGTCAIQADQAGDAAYAAAAPAIRSFTISQATQTLAFPAIASFSWAGGQVILEATASSGLAVGYIIVSGPCSVTGSTLTASAAGTCVVAAHQPGNATYGPASQVTQSATVTRAAQAISFAALPDRRVTDGAFTAFATGGGSGNPVAFSTASTACSIAGSTVNLLATGVCAIQADEVGNVDYTAAAPVIQSFTISLASQSITFPPIETFSWRGGAATLTATASSGLPVGYAVVSGTCSVAGSTLTASGAGTCIVAARQPGDPSYGPAPQTNQAVTVAQASQSVSFAPLSDKLMTDSAFTVVAVGGASGNPVTFSTISPACSVTGGTVALIAAGPCAIRASQAGNADYAAAAPVSQLFTISLAVQTLAFAPIPSFGWTDGSATLAASASSGLAVRYSVVSGPCNLAGATLAATAAGTCVVAADQAGDATFAAASQVTRTVVVTNAGQTIAFGPLLDKRMTDPAFKLSATGGGSGHPVTFSTLSATCSVTGTTVALLAVGTCVVEANQAGSANYAPAAPVVQSFDISLAPQTITFPALTAFSWSAGSASLAASASSALEITYTVVSGPCVITGSTVTATAGGTCVIAADQPGDARHSAASRATAAVVVTKAAQTIAFPAVDPMTVEDSIRLEATASSGLPVAYTIRSGGCTVSSTTLAALAAITCVVTSNQAGNLRYDAAAPSTITIAINARGDDGCSAAGSANLWLGLGALGLLVRRRRRYTA